MEIKYLGWQSFRIQEGKLVVLTQPFSQKKTKTLFPKIKADVVLQVPEETGGVKSRCGCADRVFSLNRKEVFWVRGSGEYEISGVEILGFPGGYWFKMRNFELAFWWQWEEKAIKKLAESLPNIDILFLRGDKNNGAFFRKIKKVVEKLSPSIIIPFCSTFVSKEKLRSGRWSKMFLDAFDQEDIKPVEKLVLKKEEMDSKELKIVLLHSKV